MYCTEEMSEYNGAKELYERLFIYPTPEYERKCTSSVSWVDIDALKDLARDILKDIEANGVTKKRPEGVL